jgi:hypothetical protein
MRTNEEKKKKKADEHAPERKKMKGNKCGPVHKSKSKSQPQSFVVTDLLIRILLARPLGHGSVEGILQAFEAGLEGVESVPVV